MSDDLAARRDSRDDERLERRLRRAAIGLVLLTAVGLGIHALWPASATPPTAAPAAAAPAAAAAAGAARVVPIIELADLTASYATDIDPPAAAFDGVVAATPSRGRNRWACWGSGHAEDWIAWRFPAPRRLGRLGVHFFTDTAATALPAAVRLETLRDGTWQPVPVTAEPPQPTAEVENVLRFAPITATDLRLVLVHQPDRSSAVTEIVVPRQMQWGTPRPPAS